VSHTITRRSQRHEALMQRELHRASVLHGPARVRALRCVARHCLHLGRRELAQKARQLARAGGVA